MSSCELHSRSLAVGRTGALVILRLRTRGLRNLEIVRDCAHMLRNPEIAQIPRLRGTYASPKGKAAVQSARDASIPTKTKEQTEWAV